MLFSKYLYLTLILRKSPSLGTFLKDFVYIYRISQTPSSAVHFRSFVYNHKILFFMSQALYRGPYFSKIKIF